MAVTSEQFLDLARRVRALEASPASVAQVGAAGSSAGVTASKISLVTKIAFGVATIAWPGGSAGSSLATVTHGLGATPTAVLATNKANSGLTALPTLEARTYTATTFGLAANTIDGQTPLNTATTIVAWIAIR